MAKKQIPPILLEKVIKRIIILAYLEGVSKGLRVAKGLLRNEEPDVDEIVRRALGEGKNEKAKD